MPDLVAGGLSIHYAATPSVPRRPAVVLLHGAGANHTVWLGQMQALRERAWVVIPDLPGHGRSAPIEGLTIDEYAGALIPFLEEIHARLPEGPGPPPGLFLAGHSMGGAITLAIALRRPDLLSGIALLGSGARLGVSPKIFEGLEADPAGTQRMIAQWSFAEGTAAEMIDRTVRDLAGTPAARLLADFRACNAFDVRERLAEVRTPALVLCGSEDRMTPPKSSAFLAERLPHAALEIIERAGHSAMIESAQVVSSALARFIGAVPAA